MGDIHNSPQVPYGRRLIPQVLDQLAKEKPDREAYQVPRSDDPKDGWRKVSFYEYAKTVDVCASKIVQACGRPTPNSSPTLAFIGPQDARYVVFLVAAAKTGYQPMFISPRNPAQAQVALFDQTSCRTIFCDKSFVPLVESWELGDNIQIVVVETFEDWISEKEVAHFPFHETFVDMEWRSLCVLHTSGSTGLPKPVIVRHVRYAHRAALLGIANTEKELMRCAKQLLQGMMAIADACHELGDWQGTKHWIPAWMEKSKRHFIPMPLFHAAALYVFIISVIWWETPVVFGFGTRPLTAELVMECFDHLDVESAALPPSILEDLSQDERGLRLLQNLKLVPVGGGSLARDVGDYLADRGVTLFNLLNSTECTPFPLYFQQSPKLWQYFIINSELFGCDWRKVEEDVYELVVVRKGKSPGMQGHFYTFPELQEFSTNDLYELHPYLPNHWKYYGRADNIIVFSNGEKLNPATIESILHGHPDVKGAVVIGSGRFQPALLIEPMVNPTNEAEQQGLIEKVWPSVVRANDETVAHGRIAKDLILVTHRDRPFPRAGKGSIQRVAAIATYESEIERLYEQPNQATRSDGTTLLDSAHSIETWLLDLLKAGSSKTDELHFDADTNFFAVGIDSLQVMSLSRHLRAHVGVSTKGGSTLQQLSRLVYNHPTARRLAKAIFDMRATRSQMQPERQGSQDAQEIENMKAMLARYTRDFKLTKVPARAEASDKEQCIVLTGSTGALGCHLLDQLLQNSSVTRIVCLNRARDGGFEQQSRSMALRHLTPLAHDKLEFHQIDVSQDNLGLSKDLYVRLLAEVDRIVHCAWPVNFNFSTETFEPHLKGVTSLCQFAAQAVKRVHFVFISSISTVDRWNPTQGLVLEEKLDDWMLPTNGYGRSKMIGSMILQEAADTYDFPATSIRVGQIAGPAAVTGSPWNESEWLPSIIKSSLKLSVMPRDLGRANTVNWIPIERVATSVIEIAGVNAANSVNRASHTYCNCVNPAAVTWEELAPTVQAYYGERIQELVGFSEWVRRLENSQRDDDVNATDNPALKLISTYQGLLNDQEDGSAAFDTRQAMRRSRAMRECKAITPDLMRHWCSQWNF